MLNSSQIWVQITDCQIRFLSYWSSQKRVLLLSNPGFLCFKFWTGQSSVSTLRDLCPGLRLPSSDLIWFGHLSMSWTGIPHFHGHVQMKHSLKMKCRINVENSKSIPGALLALMSTAPGFWILAQLLTSAFCRNTSWEEIWAAALPKLLTSLFIHSAQLGLEIG